MSGLLKLSWRAISYIPLRMGSLAFERRLCSNSYLRLYSNKKSKDGKKGSHHHKPSIKAEDGTEKEEGEEETIEPLLSDSPYFYNRIDKIYDNFNFEQVELEMNNVIEHAKKELGCLRIGRATPSMLDHIHIHRSEGSVLLSALSQVFTKDGNTLVVKVHDSSLLREVEKAIRDHDMAFQVHRENDNTLIVPIPRVTLETRDRLLKQVSKLIETYKTHIRNIRRDAVNDSKAFAIDDARKIEKQMQKHHDVFIKKIDELYESKRKEIQTS